MQGAAKVGALVVVFLVLLYFGFMVLGKDLFGKPKTKYFAEFADAGGLTSGSQVQLAGVKIGTVDNVALIGPELARLTLLIDSEVKIPSGSTASIPGSLIGLGEKAMLIVPPETTTGYLLAGETIKGTKAGPLDNILPNPEETVAELNRTLAAARKLLENQRLQTNLVNLLESTNKTAADFGKLAARMDLVLSQSNPQIQRTLNEALLTMVEVRKGTEIVTQILKDGRYQKEAMAMLKNLNKSAEGANKIIADVQALTGNPDFKASLEKSVANTAQMTESGVKIAQSGEIIAKNSEEISAKAIVATERLIELQTKASGLLDDVRGAVDNIKDFFKRTGGKVNVPKLETSIDLLRETDPNAFRTDLGVKVDLRDFDVHVGLWDAFESNRITVQLAKPFSPNGEYRYGIFASKPGVGVDYRLAPRLYVRGDLFDINEPRFDLRARYEFGKGFYGWVGVDRIFDKNAPTIGVGIRN